MRYLFYLLLCFSVIFLAWCHVRDKSIDIGDGVVLEIIPGKFKTVADNTRCVQLRDAIARGEIPDTSENKTETVILQEGFMDVAVTPVKYKFNGSVKTAAKAKLIIIPEVNKQVIRPVFKTPSEDVQRRPSVKCKPTKRRIISNPKSYKIKDKSGATIEHFESAEALVEYINFK